ncbi:MAG: hypothetical protein H6708_25980 [Kofleriaceae bacterium]|nr:hypothetical protein [Kofleriaceae bacterium]
MTIARGGRGARPRITSRRRRRRGVAAVAVGLARAVAGALVAGRGLGLGRGAVAGGRPGAVGRGLAVGGVERGPAGAARVELADDAALVGLGEEPVARVAVGASGGLDDQHRGGPGPRHRAAQQVGVLDRAQRVLVGGAAAQAARQLDAGRGHDDGAGREQQGADERVAGEGAEHQQQRADGLAQGAELPHQQQPGRDAHDHPRGVAQPHVLEADLQRRRRRRGRLVARWPAALAAGPGAPASGRHLSRGRGASRA